MNAPSKVSTSISQISSIIILITIIIAGGWALSIYEESKTPPIDYTQSIVEGENVIRG